jgi:hypothetical protein
MPDSYTADDTPSGHVREPQRVNVERSVAAVRHTAHDTSFPFW